MQQKRPLLLLIVCAILIFIGAGGLFGGVNFIMDPSGATLGLDPIVLQTIPILDDFLLPGVFLTTVLGILPLAMMLPMLLYKPDSSFSPPYREWKISGFIAWILIAWIVGQVIAIGPDNLLQLTMFTLAVILLILLRHRDVVVYLGFVRIPDEYQDDESE